MDQNKYLEIYNILDNLFKDARCELNYNNIFELLIATVLSAQTTDKKVNSVTCILFSKYKDAFSLANSDYDDVYNIIKPLGLAKGKATNIINIASKLLIDKNGIVPNDYDYLVTLPGVGRKTANVVLAEGFKENRIAVDTHVLRVSNRLGLSNSDNPIKVEEDLMNEFPSYLWGSLHLKLLFFGRYMCKANNMDCDHCPFKNNCKK